MKYKLAESTWMCIAVIAVVCTIVFAYTFNPMLDLNGDNCQYYMYATSLAQGEGYTEMGSIGLPAGNTFPPGYPLIMAPLRAVTESIIAQKILNGVMLFGATALLFLFLRRVVAQQVALTAVLVALLNYRVLQFATIMMSETSFLLFSALAIYLLCIFDNSDKGKVFWKNPYFFLLILVVGYSYMIRSQGIALAVGVIVWMLCARKWWQTAGFVAGFVQTTLPWTIRNKMAGLGSSRYLDQIMAVNQWQPDQGQVTFGEMIARGFDTLKMLVTKAIPDTVTPYIKVDYEVPATFGQWIVGLVLLAVIIFGFWRMRRYFWFLTTYSAAVIGIICLWSAPSGNRYIATLVPLLEVGLVIGLYTLMEMVAGKIFSVKKIFSPLWLLLPAVMLAGGRLKAVAHEAEVGVPPQFAGFFDAALFVRRELPRDVVVCSRKPSLFYVFSQSYVCNFHYTEDDVQLIRGLITSKADYVVLDQMGYAATGTYLYPAVMKHQDLFRVAGVFGVPETYLLQFDRRAAELKIGAE